jgi:hypothetical protein
MEEREKASTTVEIDKELLLKFKSICVLNELTMSEVIEEMVGDWVSKNEGKRLPKPEPESKPEHEAGTGPEKAGGAPPEPKKEELSDEMEEQVEKG